MSCNSHNTSKNSWQTNAEYISDVQMVKKNTGKNTTSLKHSWENVSHTKTMNYIVLFLT